jgi:hypothetical protein
VDDGDDGCGGGVVRTTVKVLVAIRGGFKSPRGAYSGEYSAEAEHDGDAVAVLARPGVVENLFAEATAKLRYDEVVAGRRVSAKEVRP